MRAVYRALIRDLNPNRSVNNGVVSEFRRTGSLRDTYELAESDLEELLPNWTHAVGQVEKLYLVN